jgi:hypothetical protein
VSDWAPVVAALGTGVIGFGGLWWQQRHRDSVAANVKRRDAYQQMISQSLSFSIRAQSLRNAMRARSGIGDRLDLALRIRPRDPVEMTLRSRPPLDPLQLHDWFAEGFEPINQAWSWIEIIGSPEAVEVATNLLDACADVVTVATVPGSARGRIQSELIGMQWTAEQAEALETATDAVAHHRRAFVRVARIESEKELRRDWPDTDGLFGRMPRNVLGKALASISCDAPARTEISQDSSRSV